MRIAGAQREAARDARSRRRSEIWLEYADEFHYIGPELEEYLARHAVPV